jgi:EAL domain-containing protein (putative c-di-GMP-specific phosphodiesterase class I)
MPWHASPPKDLLMTAIVTATPSAAPVEPDTAAGAVTVRGLPGHFRMYYQPQLDLHSGAILRCEALLRWWHPRFGLLRPHASLAGTRWAGDIDELDGWTALEVCRQGARWSQHGLSIQIALNVSPSFLLRPSFVESIDQTLDRSGANPYLVAIDIPVRAIASNRRRVEQVTRALTDRGVGVILDGVGAMDAGRLALLGAEAWKIDLCQSRAGGTRFHRSVGTAVEHAHQAGARAIAKAVEDDAQLAVVRSLDFDEIFGNVISPPVPGQEARAVFRSARPPRRSLFGPSPSER